MKNPKIRKREDGSIYYKYWTNKKGQFHRKDGPAYIYYYPNGNIETEIYYLNDKHHREDGPAVIYYRKDATVFKHSYYINNTIPIFPLPAIIHFNKVGKIIKKLYMTGINSNYLTFKKAKLMFKTQIIL